MKRFRYCGSILLSGVIGLGAAATAFATPTINDAVVIPRVFNDCATSNLTVMETYPTNIHIADDNTGCTAFTNLHIWRLSADNGTSAAVFNNGDCFHLSTMLNLQGTGLQAEAGLQISPWYSQNVDGRFQVRIPDGEIAAFGGALPFYSFTASYGITYVENTNIKLEVIYRANSNTEQDPATIEYVVTYEGTRYTSGAIAFANCNPAEEPTYGCYGILNDARIGGHLQGPNNNTFMPEMSGVSDATWFEIQFSGECEVPTVPTTLGRIKAQYR